MSITVRELLQLPHLQVSLIAGGSGLDRDIRWVHTSDLPNPWEWQGSGELLLTNGTGLAAEEAAQVSFVERLSETGASGLALGLGMPAQEGGRAQPSAARSSVQRPVHGRGASGSRRQRT